MDAYDITEAFRTIENELIASMIRNMDRHRAEEEDEGIQWSMWQAEQLKALEKYKAQNRKKYSKAFRNINAQIEELIRTARDTGNMQQEIEILNAIKNGFKGAKKESRGAAAAFFRLNDRKLEALIQATTQDMEKAETAILRKADDDYRKAIFNAQVYANTGAGTYEKAVDMATKDMLSSGLNCVEYANGARHTLSDYADMAIRTASKRAYLQGEGEKRQEWGVHTVIMNKRGNPCSKCLPFVGKVLIDDVWSGGSRKDGKYPLMSYAISQGLYHPRCKDSHTTYFPGISTADDTWTQKELEAIGLRSKQEACRQYAVRQEEKFSRLAEYSLDPGNKAAYDRKAAEWKETLTKYSDVGIVKLTSEEQGALQQYKSFESYIINDALRNTKSVSELTPEQRQFVKNLDTALSKMPKYEGNLIRTVDFSDWPDGDERTRKFVDEFITDEKIEVKQYWSTSKKMDFNDAAGIKIYIQNAKNGRDISSIGLDEQEVLYERNQEFLVSEKVFHKGKWHILLEEV